jgi:hypothetical protein
MSKMRVFGASVLSLAIASASVQAATSIAQVGVFSGKVLINQGEGFVPVSGSIALKTGDQILIGKDSAATVSFAECDVSLTTPTVFSVGETSPCANGEKVAVVDGALIAPAADLDPGCTSAFCATPALLPLLLIGATAATVGIVVATKKKKNNSPPAVSAPTGT